MTNINSLIFEQLKNKDNKYKMFFCRVLLEKYIFMFDGIKDARLRKDLLKSFLFLVCYLNDFTYTGTINDRLYSFDERVNYLQGKLDFAIKAKDAKDRVEHVMYDYLNTSEYMGISLQEETISIIQELLYDAQRMKEFNKFQGIDFKSCHEIDIHYYNLDIKGIAGGCLKIFDEDLHNENVLCYLGTASRTYYSLRDFIENMKKGLMNISSEDKRNFNISETDILRIINIDETFINRCKKDSLSSDTFKEIIPQSIFDYYCYKANSCIDYLRKYHEYSSRLDLRPSTKHSIEVVYEKPIQRYLRKIDYNI